MPNVDFSVVRAFKYYTIATGRRVEIVVDLVWLAAVEQTRLNRVLLTVDCDLAVHIRDTRQLQLPIY